MQDRFKFRAVLKTDKFTILVETFYILNSCYFIDINKAEVEFKCKYPDECFWDFIEEIEKQDYIQEISIDGDLIITKDFTNLVQCTGLKDKHGKLIYEGDIIKYFCPAEYCSDGVHKCLECYSGENGSVHYDEDLAMYEYRSKSSECPLTDNINTEEDLEIIGNIYENPELLSEVE